MNRQRAFLILCLLLSSLIFLACAPTIVPQPTATPAPSSTPVTLPTATPPPIPTLTPTQIPSPTAIPAVATSLPSDAWSSQSPDGQWTAQGVMEGPFPANDDTEQYHTRLEVVSVDGMVKWTLADQTLNYGLGYTTPRPFQWSADGRYLYFTNLAVPDGCSLFHNGSDLYRADLTNGQITEVLSSWVWWVSLSPDEQRLASIRWNGEALELTLRHLASGDEQRTTFEGRYTQAGGIVWSPEGQALLLTLAANPCGPAEWTQSVARVDLATLLPTILIRDDQRLFVTTAWPEAERAVLADQQGDLWTLEVTSGKLEKKKK